MIGIFGGTFDPVHYGHLRAALEAKEYFGLDEIRLIPSAKPPHRDTPQVPAAMRLDMLKLAIEHQPGFIADNREIERTGASYMVVTLESLRSEFPGKSLLLFIGTDAFNNLASWYQWEKLFDLAHVVVLTRPNSLVKPLDKFYAEKQTQQTRQLREQLAGKLYFQAITQLDISATAIRTLIAQGKNPRYLLPDAVITYINEHRLYKS
ncbi:MAG: nicotinate-nucleotide adenylyltransferase [Methylococcaceae bacterium]|nr:nicotinate-nucleotide adenylyltransferase [Methylococcaceae bacterium]